MNVGFLQRLSWFPLLFLVVGGLALGGCDSGGFAPDQRLKNGVALSAPDSSDVAAVATHREGEWLAAHSRESQNRVSEVVYGTGEGDRATIKLDGEGRPSLAVTGPYVLAFGNYNGSRADVGLVNMENGETNTFDQIEVGVDFGALQRPESDSTGLTPAQATEAAGYGVTAFACALADVSAPDLPFTGSACNTSKLLQVATGATERADWEGSAELLGWGSDAPECTNGYGASCLDALVNISGSELEEFQTAIDQNRQEVGQVYAVARFGGTWAYQDLDQSWFIIEESSTYDVVYYDFGSCYYISRLSLLDFSGDTLKYEIQESGSIFRATFDRVSADVLRATRLGTGKELEWDRASSQDLQSFIDNECGSSSSTVPATNSLSQE